MRSFAWIIAVLAAAAALAAGGSSEYNPARQRPQGAQLTGAIIVKLRPASTSAVARAQARTAGERITALAGRTGLTLEADRAITDLLHVVQVQAAGSLAQTVARLKADPDVEYAEADQRRYIHAVPDDPLYAPDQWYLQPPDPSATLAAIDAQTAWGQTTGSDTLVIADIDTGVRYDHPDLLEVGAGGRLLPGYCFISDSFVNNGGTCLGATVSDDEGSDPGDWVTQADLSEPECSGAAVSDSSWHGTRVASLLGAITNNGVGLAGVTWQGEILPVRALGKCGGTDSDIVSAMLWAAGIAVSGAPANPTPAKIINMSLGGEGSCPSAYQDAIQQLNALGVLVVVSAGNEGGPVDAPANCPGVVGVAGLRAEGTKVGYSSLGPEISLGAPAGNCVNTGLDQTCVYSMTAATNPGTTTPVAYSTVTDSSEDYTPDLVANANYGTSFSAPMVSGIGALMMSVNPNLGSCQLISRLKEGSVAYPTTSIGESPQPPVCHVPSGSSDIQLAECICTQQTCGSGMANAPGALTAASRPIASISSPAAYSAGQSITLDGSGSTAATGRTLTSYAWSQVGGETISIPAASSAKATISAPSCGLATLQLTVTDSAGATDTADVVVGPTSATVVAPAVQSAGPCGGSPVQLGICPAVVSVAAGSGGQSFTADVVNTTNTAVAWEVNGVSGGSTTVGTISTTGVYTPPAQVPSPASVTVTAVSGADSSVTATSQVTITAPQSGGGGSMDGGTLLLGGLLLAGRALRRARARA